MRAEPTPFLWVIRVLASLFLLGYLSFGFLGAFTPEGLPGESLLQNSIFIFLLLVFLVGLYFLWSNRERLAGILFIFWYTALWPCDLYITGDKYEDLPAPGVFMFIIGILSIIYWYKKKKADSQEN